MLPNNQKDNPNGVEEHFISHLKDFNPKPMDETQSELLIILLMINDDRVIEMEKEFRKIAWFYDAIDKRCEVFLTYKMEIKAKIFLCSLCKSIGDLVIYLTFIQYLCREHKIKNVTLNTLCETFFPMGVFDEQTMKKAWESQKIEREQGTMQPDNLVDYPNSYYSILYKK